MTHDFNIKAFLAQAMAYGLKTGVTAENLGDYSLGLVEFINTEVNRAWAIGDKDGILITDIQETARLVILPRVGITEFRVLGEFDPGAEDFATTCFRVILAVTGWTNLFLPDEKVLPAGGISVGDREETTVDFEDDGFGIN